MPVSTVKAWEGACSLKSQADTLKTLPHRFGRTITKDKREEGEEETGLLVPCVSRFKTVGQHLVTPCAFETDLRDLQGLGMSAGQRTEHETAHVCGGGQGVLSAEGS